MSGASDSPRLQERLRVLLSLKVVRFGIVGVIVAVFFAALNALFGRAAGLSPQLAFFAAYPPALLLHFGLNKLWTFGDRSAATHHQVGEYLYSVLVTFLIQWPAFILFQRVLGLQGWIAALFANLIQMSASFLMLRWRVFHASPEAARAQSNPWRRLALTLTLLGGVGLIYWTAAGGWNPPRFHRTESDYYNLLVSGFRKGSLAMDVAVPDSIKNSPNPWDPAQRPHGSGLHDASYYNGHYYLYFGVVPAVLLFWPFRAVAGFDLPFLLATVGYLEGAFLITAWLWLRVLRERFRRSSVTLAAGGVAVLGLCAGQLCLARRGSIWEMPISAGSFYVACFAASAYLAFTGRRLYWALAGAGLSLALAIGCRPTLVAAGPALAFLVLWTSQAGRGPSGRVPSFLRAILAAGLPFAAVTGALLDYNLCRFGNALEFGLNYQLSGAYEAKAHHFLLRFAPFNFESYFLRAPQFGSYFPFLHPLSWITPPEGYYGMEFVYGALVVCPVILGAVLALVLALRRPRTLEAALSFFFLLAAAGVTAVLCCFNTAAARYEADFLPFWLWAALLGWAWLESLESPSASRWRTTVRGIFGLCAAYSLLLAFVQGVALHGIYSVQDPAGYRRITRIFDEPAAALERLEGSRLGPVSMDITFPKFPGTVLEPILVSGVEYETDYFFVYYKAPGIVNFGYASSGEAPAFSGDVAVVAGRKYRLRLCGGALYPPDGHPFFGSWTQKDINHTKSWVELDLDGKAVLRQQRQFHDYNPEYLQVGIDRRSGAFGRAFSGALGPMSREDLRPTPEMDLTGGDIDMDVTLPGEIVPQSEPLVVAGVAGSAELVGYRPLDASRFVLTYEKWSAGYWESEPIERPPSGAANFRIRLGSLLPPGTGDYNGFLTVWMDGRPVWWRRALGGIGPNPRVGILANLIGSSAMQSAFQGNLISLREVPIASLKKAPFRTLELDLVGRGDGVEPLVVTGSAGRADLLAIEWLAGDRARIIYDHWGHAASVSRDFGWDSTHMHQLLLTAPAFASLGDAGISAGKGRLRIEADGDAVLDRQVPFYGAAAETLFVGKNTVGSSVAEPALECRVGDVRQVFTGSPPP